MEQKRAQLSRRQLHLAATETARHTGMRADADAQFPREQDAALHARRVARVAAARDVSGSDEPHERTGARGRLAFAEVAVEVELHGRK